MVTDNHSLTNKDSNKALNPIDRILRWPDVHTRVGICRSHAHQLAAEEPPRFPRPIKLGPRASGWLESEVNQWLADRIAESRPDSTNAA